MPTNQIKTYSDLLELTYLTEPQRNKSLRSVFDRDITNNVGFNFRQKLIRPIKKDGQSDLDTLFSHLTCEEDYNEEEGMKIASRKKFDFKRSERLHWIKNHIDELSKDKIDVFSYLDRIKGKNVIRTYIHDIGENYVIILHPQDSRTDYYLITAYPLTKEKGGIKQINNKSKNRLPDIH